MAFHQKFREKFTSDESTQQMQLPVYFGNVCLRFLPVLDIVIHRFVEVNVKTVHKTLETILNHFGCLYKFHGELKMKSIFLFHFSILLFQIVQLLICIIPYIFMNVIYVIIRISKSI